MKANIQTSRDIAVTKPEPRGAVAIELELLGESVERIKEAIFDLQKRLASVLTVLPPPEPRSGTEKLERVPVCPLAESIGEQRRLLEDGVEFVKLVTKALEL